jgi:UDP-glucose 4-epimerase
MRVLVTGAGGFVGSSVVIAAINSGLEVIAQARSLDSLKKALPDLIFKQICRVEADLCSELSINMLPSFDAMIHCAAVMHGDRDSLWRNNVDATRLLLNKASAENAKRIVFISTGGVYGYTNNYPSKENDPINPIGWYGQTKHLGEQLCLAYTKESSIKTVSMRLFFPYGNGQTKGILPTIRRAQVNRTSITLSNNGKPTMSFCHVDDAAQAVVLALLSNDPASTYNLCGDSDYSIDELIRHFETIGKAEILTIPSGNALGDLLGDNSKIKQDLHWHHQNSLPDSLLNYFHYV